MGNNGYVKVGNTHSKLIQNFCDQRPNAKTTKFMPMLASLLGEKWELWRIVPDAYEIWPEERTVAVIEVSVTWHLTDDKLKQYADLNYALNYEDWRLNLFEINKRGDIHQIDLWPWWLKSLDCVPAMVPGGFIDGLIAQ